MESFLGFDLDTVKMLMGIFVCAYSVGCDERLTVTWRRIPITVGRLISKVENYCLCQSLSLRPTQSSPACGSTYRTGRMSFAISIVMDPAR